MKHISIIQEKLREINSSVSVWSTSTSEELAMQTCPEGQSLIPTFPMGQTVMQTCPEGQSLIPTCTEEDELYIYNIHIMNIRLCHKEGHAAPRPPPPSEMTPCFFYCIWCAMF